MPLGRGISVVEVGGMRLVYPRVTGLPGQLNASNATGAGIATCTTSIW